MSALTLIKTAFSFLFAPGTTRADKGVILARFKIWLLESLGAEKIADELREGADLARELRRAEAAARLAQLDSNKLACLDKAVTLTNKMEDKDEARRVKAIQRQNQAVIAASAPQAKHAAIEARDARRDENTRDAASLAERLRRQIERDGGSVVLPPEVLGAIEKFIQRTGHAGPAQLPPPPAATEIKASVEVPPMRPKTSKRRIPKKGK